MIPGAMIIPVAAGGLHVPAVTFDASDYLSVTPLTGIVDGQNGTISVWLKFAAGTDTALMYFFSLGDNGGNMRLFCFRADNTSGNILGFSGWGTGATPTNRLNLHSSDAFVAADGWLHVLASWTCDGATTPQLYVNDAAPAMSSAGTSNGNIFYSDDPYQVGGRSTHPTDATTRYLGDMAEFWFDTSYMDLTVTANRRKFISAAKKPVDLGSTGNNPTGATPLIYLTGQASAFPNNLGSGGAFTVTGALSDAATSPSD